jgi:methylenetetrahydromethanopterin dehydrogenase
MVVVISPNAAMTGPVIARKAVGDTPCIIISDGPSKKIKDQLAEEGFGYIIINGDPLIGARREFLDPVEMSLFNSSVVKILAITGALRLVQEEIDRVIEEIDTGSEVTFPRIVVTAEKAVERARFGNPYARAKAIAAYKMAEKAAEMNVQACFVMKEPERYILMAAASHEIINAAAMLAEDARELEKSTDQVSRRPHAGSGKMLDKISLLEKPR